MKLLVVHDQFGNITSIAIPGQNLPFGPVRRRPGANEFVAEVDAPDLVREKDLIATVRKLSEEFSVADGPAQLMRKKRSGSGEADKRKVSKTTK
jgi:hypothetical protein